MAARILPCVIACSPAAYAEVLFEETFDRPVITSNLGLTDSRLGWENFTVGEQSSLGSGSASFTGRYLQGLSTVPVGGVNQALFIKHFPLVTTGVVTLSSDVLAASSLSYASSIGLTHHQYIGRQAQWTCTTNGWIFYVGRKDQSGQYYADPPLGVDTSSQETVVIPFGVVVKLKVSVDMDRKKTWGQASWTASGVPHTVTTAEYDWDVGLSDVSMIYICQDRRSGRAGIDIDNIKVEGTRHVARPHPFLNTAHTIYQMNGTAGAIPSTAQIQWTSRDWTQNGQMPYLAYMPDQSKLAMLYWAGPPPASTGSMTSTDGGLTWSTPTPLPGVSPKALGLIYLGGGHLLASTDASNGVMWNSTDHGSTWTTAAQSPVPTPTVYLWDPPFITSTNSDGTKNLIRGGWLPTGVPWETDSGPYSQGHVQFSTNSGATWSNPVSVPQWLSVNEVTFVRAANGNLIAACRTDSPGRFRTTALDHYCGLAVSISTDNGATWSALNKLYTWGRHQASMILLPNNDILMTYIVRLGYTRDKQGFPRFGVEAVLSHDNGATWDIDHRIILAEWSGNIRGDHAWYSGVQSSSTVALPSGTILTAFGMGFANAPDTELCVMDIGLVRWTVPSNTLNNDTYLASFDPDSDGRNLIDLKLPTGKKTLTSPFSLGYGYKNGTWNTAETSSVNTAPGGGFTLTSALTANTGSNTGPTFTSRVLGATGSSTAYQAAIVDGFNAAFTAGYSGSAPTDAATNPNYQISLNINAVSVRAAPNIDETWLQTVNFYEELPTYDLLQDPQVLVDTGNFTMLPSWDKFAWDPEEIYQPAGLISQTRTRTFKLEQDASYNVFLDGLEVVGDVNLTYDAVKPTVRKTIVSSFSKGYGWKGNSWNTSETASANTSPSAAFQLNIGFGSPGSATLSNTGPTFTNRVLGYVSASGTDYQCSYPTNFVATVSGGYVGTIPADAAGNPNYKVRVIVDNISVYSAPTTPSPTQTLALSETTSGHTQAQTPLYVTTTGNFTVLSSWAKFPWNPADYLSPAGALRQTQSRAFTMTESAVTGLAVDGFEVSGQIELSYDAEP